MDRALVNSSGSARPFPAFYGWVVVAIAFVTMGIGVNARTAFSLMFPPILDEFGWPRGLTAGAFSFGFFISALLGLSLSLLVTALGGTLLPFRHRALVDASPYGRKVAGIPVLTLVGALAVIGFGAAIGILLWDPGSGASLSGDSGKLVLCLGVYAGALAFWFAARAVRRRQGVDLDLAYRELPAE